MANATTPLLSPAGALAGHPAFPRNPTAEALGRAFASLAARELDVGDLAAAWELVRLTALEGPAALPAFWMAAALLEMRRQGHTSLELPGEVATLLGLGAAEQEAWQAFVREGAPVGSLADERDGGAPLARLADAAGTRAVALARDLAQERRLARFARRAGSARTFTPEAVRAALAASAPAQPLHAEQSEAVVTALSQSLGLVAGGPGTGKTTIILALVETALALGVPPARIALAAPTGKAARRIEEALAGANGRDAERPTATTLHGLLGLGPALTPRGPFTAAAPLPHQLVVVDEASMIGLEMLDMLTQALPPEATLVLLGDPDQLPSVEAGAAFRALVESPALQAVRLTHSHRMREDDAGGAAILHAAQESGAAAGPTFLPTKAPVVAPGEARASWLRGRHRPWIGS